MNQTRFEKYGAAVLSLMYLSMLRSSTTTRNSTHTSRQHTTNIVLYYKILQQHKKNFDRKKVVEV